MTGNDLRKQRNQSNLSQAELAEYWGVTRMTVVSWEGCKNNPVPHPKIMAILLEDLKKKFAGVA